MKGVDVGTYSVTLNTEIVFVSLRESSLRDMLLLKDFTGAIASVSGRPLITNIRRLARPLGFRWGLLLRSLGFFRELTVLCGSPFETNLRS